MARVRGEVGLAADLTPAAAVRLSSGRAVRLAVKAV